MIFFQIIGTATVSHADVALFRTKIMQCVFDAVMAITSIIAIIVISCKRCEQFSLWSLLVVLVTSVFMT